MMHKAMMNISRNGTIFAAFAFLAVFATSCDVQSGMSKKGVEKYMPSPTPTIAPAQTPEPVDPADILTVNTTIADPPTNELNVSKQTRNVKCDRYDNVQINGDGNKIDLKGGCKQVMINGDNNKLTAEAAMEFTLNGDGNTVSYTKFANGRRPEIKNNGEGNVVEKIAASAGK